MIKKYAIHIAAFIVAIAIAIPCHAAEYYVNLSLGSGGSGTSGDPWGALNSARTSQGAVSGGDTVYVWGTGTQNVIFTSADNDGSDVTYIARPGYSTPTLHSSSVGNGVGLYFQDGTAHIVIDGFEIYNYESNIRLTENTYGNYISYITIQKLLST
jgi:hypothetical protein